MVDVVRHSKFFARFIGNRAVNVAMHPAKPRSGLYWSNGLSSTVECNETSRETDRAQKPHQWTGRRASIESKVVEDVQFHERWPPEAYKRRDAPVNGKHGQTHGVCEEGEAEGGQQDQKEYGWDIVAHIARGLYKLEAGRTGRGGLHPSRMRPEDDVDLLNAFGWHWQADQERVELNLSRPDYDDRVRQFDGDVGAIFEERPPAAAASNRHTALIDSRQFRGSGGGFNLRTSEMSCATCLTSLNCDTRLRRISAEYGYLDECTAIGSVLYGAVAHWTLK
ncbi:hypothetical protein B0H12DRAFT_1069165 [Mycena haematopus]|nr:hypothetical protein B0H12DRAFT_1069165 [Mycena haematopus]